MFSLMIWAQLGGTVAWVGLKPTAPRVSPTQDRGAVLYHIPTGPASRQPTVVDVQDRDHSLSLSSAYKKEKASRRFLPHHCFSPNAEVRPTSARCQLTANWPGHWAIPFSWMILTPLRSFCPRFRDHRSTTPTSTADHAGNFRRHR
jgi:hypothetical protein